MYMVNIFRKVLLWCSRCFEQRWREIGELKNASLQVSFCRGMINQLWGLSPVGFLYWGNIFSIFWMNLSNIYCTLSKICKLRCRQDRSAAKICLQILHLTGLAVCVQTLTLLNMPPPASLDARQSRPDSCWKISLADNYRSLLDWFCLLHTKCFISFACMVGESSAWCCKDGSGSANYLVPLLPHIIAAYYLI